MVSKTRKAKHSLKALSVPELRRAFEHIDRFVDTKVLRLSENEGVIAFRKEWKKTFGQISEKAAKDYLDYMRRTSSKKGGALISPAPNTYEMIEGTGGPSVPPYIVGGLDLPADSQIGQAREFPLPAIDIGDNRVALQNGGRISRSRRSGKKTRKQKGGALPSFGTALSEFVSRPFGMSAPPTASQDTQMMLKGYNQFSSPRPEVNDLNFSQGRTVYNASISPMSKMF